MAGKDKVAALVLDQPGAPAGWHMVDGLAGLAHPDIPVPHQGAKELVDSYKARYADAEKAWDAHEREQEEKGLRPHGRLPFERPPVPVKLVYVTAERAEQGTLAHAEARGLAVRALREARRSQDDVEAALAHNETEALSGGEG